MQSYSFLLATALAWCAGVALAQMDLASQVLQDTPKCALPCVLDIFTSGTCSADSIAPCVCTNVTIQANLSMCAQASCSFQDQLRAVAIETSICAGYPQESRSNQVKLTAIICSAVVFPIVLLRFLARIYTTKQLWLDDYIIMAAAVAQAGIAGIEIVSADKGFGMHYWQINPNNAELLFKLFWVTQMLYIFIQVFAKLAILMLMARVFPTRGFQMTMKVFGALLVLHGIIFLFLDIFQCVPIAAIWDRTITGERCIDITAMGHAGAAFSIFEDVFLLVLPIPMVVKLQMNWKKRIGVMFIFGLGSFATITSMVRLKYLVKFSSSFDLTWDNVDVVQWSVIEEFSALLCGSLPTLWPLVARVAPRVFGSRANTGKGTRMTDNSITAVSNQGRNKSQIAISGITEFPSEEELQHIPDKASDKASTQGEYPPLTPPHHEYGIESYSVHHHKERIAEP